MFVFSVCCTLVTLLVILLMVQKSCDHPVEVGTLSHSLQYKVPDIPGVVPLTGLDLVVNFWVMESTEIQTDGIFCWSHFLW